ncbi:PREDICTED: probable cyclic nucleotide-gated ion channel 6 [Camelina sativa]|uniref:Probable cyclic nucleotide-gated ion channel 6 n=1 Tax=Camelina sativa TaxID=90675 RepID=A0ABM0SWH6_CAMSA|nr:PREDICTED: probable cyclic nucleotide-gated ion channel 6 [Camelina sativa]
MFDTCGSKRVKSQVISGQLEKFVRLDSMDSRYSQGSEAGLNKCTLNIQGPKRFAQGSKTSSGSFKKGFRKGSEGLWSIGRSIGLGVSRAVFPEDLEVSEKKIFDPQDKFLLLCNKLFVASCILAVSVDPLFLYLPFINDKAKCVGIDRKLAIIATTIRTVIDSFYLFHMALRFRTAYVAPSSRVFGRGELVIDPAQIAKRYLQQYFIIDLLSVLPVPQIVVWRFLFNSMGANVLATKQALRYIVLVQYIPRFLRMYPLSSELKRTAGVFAETAWAGAAYYLLLYMLASHIVGALWYLLALERNNDCWSKACHFNNQTCARNFLFCGNQNMKGYAAWDKIKVSVLQQYCPVDVPEDEEPPFDFGIYLRALSSGIVSSKNFVSKYFFCLWWGLQNLSTLGQGLETSTYPGEVIFSITLAIAGLLLFALLIGNMQTYLQSLTIRLEEMRVKRRDSEQWMHHRMLPPELRERVRRYDQYKWLETRGVDEENLVQNLPKDLRRDIKRHLCLALVRRVPLFENMDERLLDAICERLKPCLFTEKSYLVREGDPVNEMLFIIRGRLESVTTDGGRSGFFNRSLLKEGDFCGDELLTWALDPKSGANLPSSTRTVKALTEVEAFALIADELKFVASQFRRLHSRQVQHTFRFYSQQWRTWAACFIQAAWRRYTKRKKLEQLRKEEEEEEESAAASVIAGGSPYSIRATFLASKFAANALRSVHKNRTAKSALLLSSTKELVKFQKPPEPDFSAEDH